MNENKNTVTALIIGILIGCLVTGFAGYTAYNDSQAKSSAIIGQLREEQQRSNDLNRSITNGITDTIEKLGNAKGLSEKNSILFGELRKIINLFPDIK